MVLYLMRLLGPGLSGVGLTSSLGVAVVALVCWYYWTHRRVLAVARRLHNGPPALPIIGHGYFLLTGLLNMMNVALSEGQSAVKRGIYSVALWIGPYPIITLIDPEDVQTLFNSSRALERGPEVKFGDYILGNGLLTAPVPIWKITRRHMNPLFNPRNLELLLPVLNQCGKDLVLTLSSNVDQGEVDVEPHVYDSIFKATCALVLGPKLTMNEQSEKVHLIMEALDRVSRLVVVRSFKFWLWPDVIFNRVYKKDLKYIFTNCRRFFQRPIEVNGLKNLQTHQPKTDFNTKNGSHLMNNNYSIGSDDSCSGQITLVDVYRNLQQIHPSFTDEDFQSEAITMLGAGAETTKIIVSSCLLALAANPSIQEKLFREIVSVVGRDKEVTLDSIRDMPYLEQVLKETLRRFNVVSVTTRKLQDDIKLSNFTLPAGSTVGVFFEGIHFDPRTYPDPDRFDPERFLPENVANRAPHTFVAFGGGPRNCIGKTYAMMSMKTVLVHVLRRFELSTTVDIDNMTYVMGMAKSSAYGYPIQIKTRS